MAKAELVLGIGGVGCNIMSDTVTKWASYICTLCVDTSESIDYTLEVVLNGIQQNVDDVLMRIKEGANSSRIVEMLERDAGDVSNRMEQQLWSKTILLFDAGAATYDLAIVLKEMKPDSLIDLSVHQNRHSPENMFRHLQWRGKMTQILDAFKRTRRARSESVRRPFDYSMTISKSGDQSWVTTGLCSEILNPENTKQYDSNGFSCGMQNALMAANQSISEILRSFQIRCVHPLTEPAGTEHLHQQDSMLGNERICTTADQIDLQICDRSWRPIPVHHISKLFVFFPKLQKDAGSGQIPVMLAA